MAKISNDPQLDERSLDYKHSIQFLEPGSCGSTIGWSVGREYGSYSCKVTLSDCNRKIDWNFDATDDYHFDIAMRKIDTAIRMLQAFRAAYVRYWGLHRKWRQGYDMRVEARKAENKK